MNRLLLFGLVLGACSGPPDERTFGALQTDAGDAGAKGSVCEPGRSVACAGPAGCSGAQVCKANGNGWGACECDAQEKDGGSVPPPGTKWSCAYTHIGTDPTMLSGCVCSIVPVSAPTADSTCKFDCCYTETDGTCRCVKTQSGTADCITVGGEVTAIVPSCPGR